VIACLSDWHQSRGFVCTLRRPLPISQRPRHVFPFTSMSRWRLPISRSSTTKTSRK